MLTTIIAVSCLVALVVTQGVIAYSLVRKEKESTPDTKVIRTRV